jgi:ArsR family transcriptional regulator, arsenate/arsenite/antimonite-responsive transcriptional repressor / arsenate reductase (thioredoxin)
MEITDAIQIFSALSTEARLAVLRLLVSAGPTGLPAGVIAERIGLPSSTASFHLSALERAGLTQSTRQSRQIIHAVRFAALRDLIVFLTETCCSGRPELCGDIARLLPDIPKENGPMTPAFNVLFLCTRNSARSLMAEAILTRIGGDRFRSYSAGSDPAPEPMPEVIEKLKALGHDVSAVRCKSWKEFTHRDAPRMDFVIALCDILEGQDCPDFGDQSVTAAWPLPGPAKFAGGSTERALLLNELYASLHRRISIFTSLPFASLDRMSLRHCLDDLGEATVSTGRNH